MELTFGADTEHIMTSPFAKGDITAIIECWHSILKERTKVMKAFRNIDTLIQFTDGFLVYYNYLRPHESLKGKTQSPMIEQRSPRITPPMPKITPKMGKLQ